MKTPFSTGPGFYAAVSRKEDDTVPPDTMRLYIARLEACDMPKTDISPALAATKFKLLVAMSVGNPPVARALLSLHESLTANLALLKEEAKR